MKRCLLGFLCLFVILVTVYGDTFPSLLTTNATIAIVIEREYIPDEYDKVKETIEKYLVYAKREILRHGGINVRFYSWTKINVQRDFSAVISIASCASTWELFNAVADENLLHIAITEPDCARLPLDEAVTTPIILNGEEMPQLLLDLRMNRAIKWSSLVLVHDNTLDRDMVTRVINAFALDTPNKMFTSLAISLVTLSNQTSQTNRRKEIETQLKELPLRTTGMNFLVIASMDMLETILEVAKGLGLVIPTSQWLFVISDTDAKHDNISSYASMLGEGENVAFAYNSTIIRDDCKFGIISQVEDLLQAFVRALDAAIVDEEEMSYQIPDEEWEAIRPSKQQRSQFLLNYVKIFLKDFGVCGNCTRWQFRAGDTWGTQFQRRNETDVTKLLNVGHWRPIDGVMKFDSLFPHVEHGFRGRVLPLVSFHNPPWQILKVNESGDVVEWSGVLFNIVNELSRSLNFTFKIILADTLNLKQPVGIAKRSLFPRFGDTFNSHENDEVPTSGSNETRLPPSDHYQIADVRIIKNITDRVIDIVRKKTAMMAVCGMTVTNQRKHLVNFTMPISVQTYTFMVSRPKELSRALLFMSPFTSDTWLCLVAAVTTIGPILYLIHRYSPVYEYFRIKKPGGLSSIHHCLWYTYGALMQQGGMYLPYADSGRLVIGTWWLVVLVVVTTYSGNLVAFLTFPKIDNPINSINDLLEHRAHVSWSILKGTYIEEQLRTTDYPKFQQLYDGAKWKEEVEPEIIDGILAGRHVYFDWKSNLQFIMRSEFLRTNRCDLILSPDEFMEERLAMIVSKDNPYLTMLNTQIKRLHQMGLIEKWVKEFSPKKDRCWNSGKMTEVKNHTVNMDDMQGSFFVLILGFVFATLVIITEKCWNHSKIYREKKFIKPFMT